MWLLLSAMLLGLWFGRAVKDVLSAVFLTCCSVGALFWVVTHAPDMLASSRAGRAVLEHLGVGGHLQASFLGLLLVAVPMVLFSAAISRQPDRLKHWDEFGPQKRHGRRRAHA